MFIGGGLILGLVIALTAYAIVAAPANRRWLTGSPFIIGLGIAFPTVTLTALLVYGLVTTRELVAAGSPALRIEVIGERWWWRVNYLDARNNIRLASANEIRIPVGSPIEFVLKTRDVIHSFWVPNLAGKLDMIPGRANSYRFAADAAGVYRGQCAEYCGAQHTLMAFHVVAMEPGAFESWFAAQGAPAAEPSTALMAEGRSLFVASGCAACHAIRGTPAAGRIGPDLTHVGGRLSIAAGTYQMNVGHLAEWIASAQHLKPENIMPSFRHLETRQVQAIAAYLESLK